LIYVITHGDLDGLASATILYDTLVKSEGVKIALRIAQPFTLHEVLKEMELRSVEELYILDIGVDSATWHRVRESLKEVPRAALKLWIDHHRASLSKLKELCELNISLIYTVSGCTSTIMREAFLERTSDPEFYAKIALIGEVGDKVKELGEGDPLFPIIRKLGAALSFEPSDEAFKVNLIKMWVKERRLLNEEVERRAEEASKKFRELSSIAPSKVIFEGGNFLILDFRDVEARGFVGKVASDLANRTGKAVFILFTSSPYETVITARLPKGSEWDVAKLLGSIAFKVGGSGGGHAKAASIRFPSFRWKEVIEGIKGALSNVG